jgi:hypothetical protein
VLKHKFSKFKEAFFKNAESLFCPSLKNFISFVIAHAFFCAVVIDIGRKKASVLRQFFDSQVASKENLGAKTFVRKLIFFLGGGSQRPLVPLLFLGPPFFPSYSFWVHHPVNRDARHILAHAMAPDFSVA